LLPVIGIEDRNIENSSQAIYGQLSFDVSDAVELTLGARQTEEQKDVVINKFEGDPAGFIAPLVDSADISEPSLMANLSWDLSDDSMVYFQFSDGFRNGGFPARVPAMTTLSFDEASYTEEFVETLEWGLKTTALDGDLRANLAIFKSEYTDMQINATIFDPGTGGNVGTVQNIGDSEISGIELEANYLVNDNFRVDASLGYLQTKLKSISSEDIDGNVGFFANEGTNIEKFITVDSDVELPHAPELQVNLGANYSLYLDTGAEIRNRIDLFYESDQYASIANYNADLIPSTTRINYLVSYIPSDAAWELTLGARNLTNEEDILNTALETSPRAGLYHVLGRGREAYLQFKYSFGE
jgi:iron complex outermembrane receptor protein